MMIIVPIVVELRLDLSQLLHFERSSWVGENVKTKRTNAQLYCAAQIIY